MGFYPNEGDVDANGAEEVNLRTAAGAELLGQQVSAASLPVVIASNQSNVPVSMQAPGTRTRILKTGSLTTTATTADQVVLTYTVTALKTFYMNYLTVYARYTTFPGNINPVAFGDTSLEIGAGTKVLTYNLAHYMVNPNVVEFSEPMQIAAGTVVRVVCTPAAATSFRWIANFGGYEI